MPTAALAQRPKLDRLAVGVGIMPPDDQKPVDRDGGDYGAGLIRGVAVMTRGDALGHGMFIDAVAIQQTADLINGRKGGVKSRFTHPSLSGDGMGKQLGRVRNASVAGDIVRGDLHFTKTSHKTPSGDLADQVMSQAEETPEDFGNSIAFEHDIEAENAFVEQHGGVVLDADWGEYDLTGFTSPDPANVNNYFHVRLKELRGVDVVDEPAANPSGLFHRGQEIPAEADALCAYALGLSDTRPASAALGIDPDRLRGFASRFLSHRGLAVAKTGAGLMPGSKLNAADGGNAEGGQAVADETQTNATETATGTESSDSGAGVGSEAVAGEGDGDGATQEDGLSAFRKDLARFRALDPTDGPKWFEEGKTFEQAQGLAMEKLAKQRDDLQTRLASVNRGETAPLTFSTSDANSEEGATKTPTCFSTLSPALAQFASGITLPGR